MVRPSLGAKLRMMFAVCSFVESLNFTAASMMVVTDWFNVRVDGFGLVEVSLFFFHCFDGLKLLTHQSGIPLL